MTNLPPIPPDPKPIDGERQLGLRNCPWCGKAPTELHIGEGSTYRWMIVTPNCCGDLQGEMRRSPYPAELGTDEDKGRAAEWWNNRFDSPKKVVP